MVEQSRTKPRVVVLQAGPVEVAVALSDVSLRGDDRAVRAIGRQLAAIGDRLVWDWAQRPPPPLPTPLHMLAPARALTRTIYRGILNQQWGFQGASSGPRTLRAAWISNSWAGWTTGLVGVTLVVTASICTALWVEWKQ